MAKVKLSYPEPLSFTAHLPCTRHGAVLHTSSAALTATCLISQLEKRRPTEAHQHVQGHRACWAAQRRVRHGGGNEAAPQRPQLPISLEGRPDPQRGHSFAHLRQLIQIVKKNYSKLRSQAKRFLHALSVSYSTLERGLANDGGWAKWPNVLFGKEGFTGTWPHPFIYTLSAAALTYNGKAE